MVSWQEYPFSGEYPPFCQGLAYFMSMDAVTRTYHASKSAHHIWLDDVYITGLLAQKAGIKHKAINDLYYNKYSPYQRLWQSHFNPDVKNYLFSLTLDTGDMHSVFKHVSEQ